MEVAMTRAIHVPASTVLLVIRRLSEQAELPSVISDASLKRLVAQSGTVRKGVRDTFKSLDLIDSDNVPTTRLRQLVTSFGKPEWAGAVKEFLKAIIPDTFSQQTNAIDIISARTRVAAERAGDQTISERALIRFIKLFAAQAGIGLGPHQSSIDSGPLMSHALPDDELLCEHGGLNHAKWPIGAPPVGEEVQRVYWIKLPASKVENPSPVERDAINTLCDAGFIYVSSPMVKIGWHK
jgi:hypothetical protein